MEAKRSVRIEAASAWAPIGVVALVIAVRFLPQAGVGLALKLLVVSYAVLLVPGALLSGVLRWREPRPVGIAAALVWSLMAVFAALALTFVFKQSIAFTIAALGGLSAIGFGAGLVWRRRSSLDPEPLHETVPGDMSGDPTEESRSNLWSEHRLELGLIAVAIVLSFAVWKALPAIRTDGLEHLSRARKLAEFNRLDSLSVVDQYRAGGLDPGYAFPLWHGVLALIARIARIDVALVARYLPPILFPLSVFLLYGAGRTLFGSAAGGIATALAEVARLGFSFADAKRMTGVGWFVYMWWPGQTSIFLLMPALLTLVFASIAGARRLWWCIGAAALALAVIHASYAVFILLPLIGFLAVRAWLSWTDRAGLRRLGGGLAAMVLASGLFFAWLFPVLGSSNFFRPSVEDRQRAVDEYSNQVQASSDTSFRLSPSFVISGSGGAVAAAALVAIPAAVLSPRSRWAGYVLGGSLAVLGVALLPPLFSRLAAYGSLSQGRRLAAFFVPWPLAVAGGVLLLSRLKVVGAAVALAAGAGLLALFPTIWHRSEPQTAPVWPIWIGVAGGLAALAVGRFLTHRSAEPRISTPWAIAAAVAFVAPLAASGLSNLQAVPDEKPLTPGLIAAIRRDVPQRQVVLSTPETSYRIEAYAPVYVVAVPRGHARATEANRHFERIEDADDFFAKKTSDRHRRKLLAKYDVDWIVVLKTGAHPKTFFKGMRPVYEDNRFALYQWASHR